MRVVWRSGSPSFTRITGGRLRWGPDSYRGPAAMLGDLWRILRDLEGQWALTPVPEAPREPLGGGGGADVPLTGMEDWSGSHPLDRGLDDPEDSY